MQTLTLDSVSKLGNNDPTYGQRYWCTATEIDVPISFSSKEDIELTESSGPISIVYEESSNKRSAKGTDYLQLKKVKTLGGSSAVEQPTVNRQIAGSSPASPANDLNAMRELYKLGKSILSEIQALRGLLELKTVPTTHLGLKPSTEPSDGPQREWQTLGKPKDELHDVPQNILDGERVNLDDIPF